MDKSHYSDTMKDMPKEERVTITLEEYNNLRNDRNILNALYAAGVDNWEWYGDAMDMVEE